MSNSNTNMRDIDDIQNTTSKLAMKCAKRLLKEHNHWVVNAHANVQSADFTGNMLAIEFNKQQGFEILYKPLFELAFPIMLRSPFTPEHTSELIASMWDDVTWKEIAPSLLITHHSHPEPVLLENFEKNTKSLFKAAYDEADNQYMLASCNSKEEVAAEKEKIEVKRAMKKSLAQISLVEESLHAVLKEKFSNFDIFNHAQTVIEKALQAFSGSVSVDPPLLSGSDLKQKMSVDDPQNTVSIARPSLS